MPKPQKADSQLMLSPTSQMAFAVAVCALAAAGIGMIVNHWLTGWMAVGGMVGVGLFYTAIGILNLRSNHPLYDDDLNVSQRTARAENLFGEAVQQTRTISAKTSDGESDLGIRMDRNSSVSGGGT